MTQPTGMPLGRHASDALYAALAAAMLVPGVAQAAGSGGPVQPVRSHSEIVVTGSRLAGQELAGVEPVVAIRVQQIEDFAYSHFADALDDFPGFQGSLTPEGPQGQFGQGVNFVNAFGLGSNRTLVLVDSRHGLKDVDREMMKMLDETAVSYRIVLTKTDKIKASDLERVAAQTAEEARKHPAAFPELHLTSAEKGMGIEELRAAVLGDAGV